MQRQTRTKVRDLAERQHGVVARRQLLALGLGPRVIEREIGAGRFLRLYAGVYALGHGILTPQGRLMAAVLACGPTALLSHRTAAAQWELLSTGQTRVDLIVPGESRKPQAGIRVHRTRHLDPEDAAVLGGMPITSVARTIVDLTAVLRPQQELEVIEHADRAHLLNLLAVTRALDRRPHLRGAGHLRSIIEDYAGAPDIRSALERRFLTLIRKAGLPEPLLNARVAGFIVDVHWPQWRLVVELDSRGYHLSPRAFEADRVRDAKLQRLRITTLRITDKRMKSSPAEVIDDILALAAQAA